MSSPLVVKPVDIKNNECTMCISRHRKDLPEFELWQVSSTNLNRRTIMVLCDQCMESLIVQVQESAR